MGLGAAKAKAVGADDADTADADEEAEKVRGESSCMLEVYSQEVQA